MTHDKQFSFKRMIKSKHTWWERVILYGILIFLIWLCFNINNIVIDYNNDTYPELCGNYGWLKDLHDNHLFFCYVNCADKFGCDHSYNNATYYNNITDICYCSGFMEIDFNSYGTDWAKKTNITFPAGQNGLPTGIKRDYEVDEYVLVYNKPN